MVHSVLESVHIWNVVECIPAFKGHKVRPMGQLTVGLLVMLLHSPVNMGVFRQRTLAVPGGLLGDCPHWEETTERVWPLRPERLISAWQPWHWHQRGRTADGQEHRSLTAGGCGKSFHGVNTFAWLCQVRWLSPYHGSWTHSTAVPHITTTTSSPARELVQCNVLQNLQMFRFYAVNVYMSTAEYRYSEAEKQTGRKVFFSHSINDRTTYLPGR